MTPASSAPNLETTTWRARRTAVLVTLSLGLFALATSCGDNGLSAGFDPPPIGDPAHGEAAQVLIENLGLRLWVGVDDLAVADRLRANQQSKKQEWLIAEVVPEDGHRHGFYFAPATVTSDEVTIEAYQTTVDQIRADPDYYMNGGRGGFPRWAVIAEVIDVRD